HEAAATRAAGAAAGAARTATGAARRRSAGSEDHGRSAPPGALALGAFALAGHWRAAELRAHLVDPLGIDLTVGALEPLEHLRRQGRELLFGDRGRLLAWLTAELLPQLREALRIAECVVAHLRAHFGPALRIDRTVGVLDPVEHRLRQAFEVGRGRHGIGSLGRAETRAELLEHLRVEAAALPRLPTLALSTLPPLAGAEHLLQRVGVLLRRLRARLAERAGEEQPDLQPRRILFRERHGPLVDGNQPARRIAHNPLGERGL